MPRIECHVPIRVRVTGRPTEADLTRLEDTVARAVAKQLVAADRAIRANQRAPQATRPTSAPAQDPLSANGLGTIASYGDGGRPVAVPLRQRTDPASQALANIAELLSTGLFDWQVSDAEAVQALAALRGLAPLDQLRVLQALRQSGRWQRLLGELPERERELAYRLEFGLGPQFGPLTAGDQLELRVRAGEHSQPDLHLRYTVSGGGITARHAGPVPVAGRWPQAAADAVAVAYRDADLFLELPTVDLQVIARGPLYAPRDGEITAPVWVQSVPLEPGPKQRARQARIAHFADYVAKISGSDPLTSDALRRYAQWTKEHAHQAEFLIRTPGSVWDEALAQADRAPLPTRRSPRLAFLELAAAQQAQSAARSPQEQHRTAQTRSRFVAWLGGRSDEELGRTDPVEAWARIAVEVIRDEVGARVRGAQAQAADQAADLRFAASLDVYGQALKYLQDSVLPVAAQPRRVEDNVHGIGYLVWPSDSERDAKRAIASAYLDALRQRLGRPGFRFTSPDADFRSWLRDHPELLGRLLHAQAYPSTEQYAAPIHIPEWQTAIELGVGLIPVVGTVVAGYEVIAGQDLFGRPLSTVDRAILAAAVLLPAAAKIFKLGRAGITAGQLARDYRLSTAEATALLRATSGLAPGTRGAALLGRAAAEVRAGRSVRDAQQLTELGGLFRELGLTDKAAAAELRQSRQALVAAEERAATTIPPAPPTPTPPPPPPGSPGHVPTLFELQRGAAARLDAEQTERVAADLVKTAAGQEAEAARIAGTNPRRAGSLRRRAAMGRRVGEQLRADAGSLRGEAGEYERGIRSAVADLPGPADLPDTAEAFASLITTDRGVSIPLNALERQPDLLPRLVRPLLRGTHGGRVVFRVEGPGNRRLLSLTASNDVRVKRETIHLNFGSEDRAREFLAKDTKHEPGTRIIAFEVREDWVRSARSAAIPEHQSGHLAGQQPRLVDVTYADDQMEIPASLIDEFRAFIIPGSGRVIEIVP